MHPLLNTYLSESMSDSPMIRILVGSPVRQNPEILEQFLVSLRKLDVTGLQVDYCFVDDNDTQEASQLLTSFVQGTRGFILTSVADKPQYERTESTHHWNESLVWRVASHKDRIIEYALARGYDYLFLVDSDLVLHPLTLKCLIAAKKDIVAEIFWTRWRPDQPELPQVWLFDQYNLFPLRRGKQVTQQQVEGDIRAFLQRLRQPGVYRVGGLGACTLISRRALAMGACFREIPNLSFWGEDRHFCIRAAALGLELYVDTHVPAYHIYRQSDLKGVSAYLATVPVVTERLRAINTLRCGLETWGTTRYDSATGLEGLEYFTEELQVLLRQDAPRNVARARTTKSTTITRTGQVYAVELNEACDEAGIVIEVLNEGEENGERFSDRFLATAVLRRVDGSWRIAHVEFDPIDQEIGNQTTSARS